MHMIMQNIEMARNYCSDPISDSQVNFGPPFLVVGIGTKVRIALMILGLFRSSSPIFVLKFFQRLVFFFKFCI